jgi:hypothetical protein
MGQFLPTVIAGLVPAIHRHHPWTTWTSPVVTDAKGKAGPMDGQMTGVPQPGPAVYLFFLFGACVSADAATDFIALEELGLASIFPAFEATDFDVRSLILFIAAYQMENT